MAAHEKPAKTAGGLSVSPLLAVLLQRCSQRVAFAFIGSRLMRVINAQPLGTPVESSNGR